MKKIITLLILAFALCSVNLSNAQEPFIGEMRMFAGNFAPSGWALCDGQLLPIAQYQALFSILGTTYGGDGETTFALPDLRGRAPVHAGNGPGLPNVNLGEKGGATSFTLGINNMPTHSHTVNAAPADGTSSLPANNYPAQTKTLDPEYATSGATTTMNSGMIGNTGGGQLLNHRSPYTSVNFIIALVGVFPSN
ncbi:phage tail protein [uncultured Winogradskyella sp.]|uniref:phage tail protein n=1 Tax=uncultured Winogradskyella sp. TaxID=395353 RepID=UPI00261BD3F8|nr:tail fiber protein [uncultured Winogradskyella sp.]